MSHEEAIDITRKQIRMTWIKAGSVLVGFCMTCVTIGYYGGDWRAWREQTTKDVNELQRYVYPQNYQAEMNKERADFIKHIKIKEQ